MPGEPVTEPEDEPDFEEALEKSKFWNLDTYEEDENVTIPKNIVRFLWNISGYCTDPCDKELYKNSEAMFEALDLVYLALDEAMKCAQTNGEKVKR
jgi:hypothetical protein